MVELQTRRTVAIAAMDLQCLACLAEPLPEPAFHFAWGQCFQHMPGLHAFEVSWDRPIRFWISLGVVDLHWNDGWNTGTQCHGSAPILSGLLPP